MSAYNKFRGVYSSENDYLINKILKGEWGFRGPVMSDWNGTHSTGGAVTGGLDLEMGTDNRAYKDFYLADPFAEGIRSGRYSLSLLDDKARRNLRQMFATYVFDGRAPGGAINTKEHQAAARHVAEEGVVLLKNEGEALPLDPNKVRSVAVIGENAVRLHAYGGGSAGVKAFYEVTPLEGIVRRASDRTDVAFSMGYRAQGDGEELTARAVRAAGLADVAVIIGGLNHDKFLDAESADRKDLKLPYGQDELIGRVVAANPRTIVVLFGGGPVEMGPWLSRVPAVVQAWYPGMEGGNAVASILFGDVNPSGKLPCTFPKRLEDSPAHALGAYPGENLTVRYEEGLLVGYRWFDAKRVEPLFPFGHGLSYTRFAYSGLRLAEGRSGKGPALAVEFEVSNTGARDGAEVAQIYVGDESSSLPRPPKELKGFRKVFLKAGQRQTVSVTLDQSAFAFYDPERRQWVAEKGDFKIMVGSSSRDIRLEGNFRLARTVTAP
jgi:beta-glucosidase